MALAAEFKRASPSKGDIAVDMDIEGMKQDNQRVVSNHHLEQTKRLNMHLVVLV